jgi:FtsZ-binding cell division protein ZapB
MNLKIQTAFDQFLVQQDVTEIKTQKNGLENKTENKTQPYDYIQFIYLFIPGNAT